LYGKGAANLRLFKGGWAKGIPRYSDTVCFQEDACPITVPLVVLTVSPVTQGDPAAAEAAQKTPE
jgi:hypothetical protein